MSSVMQALGLQSVKPIDLTKYITVAAKETLDRAAKAVIEDGKAWLYANERYTLSIKLGITAMQEGSGQPSPENVRPIIGWTEVQLYVSPTTEAQDGVTYTIDLGEEVGTVYGGTLDTSTGQLIVDRKGVTITGDDVVSVDTASTGVMVASLTNGLGGDLINNSSNICSQYTISSTASVNNAFRIQTTRRYIYDNRFTDLATAKSILDVERPTVVCMLREPVIYQLTPTNVTASQGENNIWADCGPIIEALY